MSECAAAGRSLGEARFFDGIFSKDRLKWEVISMFMFGPRKCVSGRLCVPVRIHLDAKAGSNYSVLQAFKPANPKLHGLPIR